MTEAEWLVAEQPKPEAMLAVLGPNVSLRKLRHFLVACARRVLPAHADAEMIKALTIAELYADGLTKRQELKRSREALTKTQPDRARRWSPLYSDHIRSVPAWHANREQIARAAGAITRCCAWSSTRGTFGSFVAMTYPDAELAAQAVLLRDIFGNPFRPVTRAPEWLTSDVLLLARGIYDEKGFDRMPILADALQDAGCTNDDVLNHCRDVSQVHVRGCWVVDLLLGKE